MKPLRYVDPIYWFVWFVNRGFLKVKLTGEEREFIEANMKKQHLASWINVVISVSVLWALQDIERANLEVLITSLLAPVMVMGAAWFSISFGGIPTKLIHVAMGITFWMFLAFLTSLSAMFLAVGFISPVTLYPALIIIYFGAVVSCLQYDTSDGLKSGLDDTLLKHSRAALRYYQKHGIEEGGETD